MDDLREALLKVRSGTSDFAPPSESLEDLRDFQPLAKCLYAAHEDGLIQDAQFVVSHRRESHGWFKVVLTSGGLTYKGDQWLSQHSAQPSAFRTWVAHNSSQFIVAVLGAVVAAVIITLWGIQ
jgi:hypothetical protein